MFWGSGFREKTLKAYFGTSRVSVGNSNRAWPWSLSQVRYAGGGAADSVLQYIFYQPIIHRWRETDFFPCSVTCGGGEDAGRGAGPAAGVRTPGGGRGLLGG